MIPPIGLIDLSHLCLYVYDIFIREYLQRYMKNTFNATIHMFNSLEKNHKDIDTLKKSLSVIKHTYYN